MLITQVIELNVSVVLVIDSDQIRGAKLKKILNNYGYRVYTAVNFKEARRIIAEKKKIDVALLSSKRFDLAPGQIIEDFNLGKPVIVILEKFSEEIAASALKDPALGSILSNSSAAKC